MSTDGNSGIGAGDTMRMGPAMATGVIAGIAGGLGFGVLMQTEGMLPLVANLVGGSASSLGWAVHLAISIFVGVSFAVLGISFAIIFSHWATSLLPSTLLGLAYGAFWWVLGGLLLMPAWLGMDVFVINDMAWTSLVGHLIYGLILGLVYGLTAPRLARRMAAREGHSSTAKL